MVVINLEFNIGYETCQYQSGEEEFFVSIGRMNYLLMDCDDMMVEVV